MVEWITFRLLLTRFLIYTKMRIMICPMKTVTLSPDQKVDLEALHDASRDKRVCDRIKAVLLRSEGW